MPGLLAVFRLGRKQTLPLHLLARIFSLTSNSLRLFAGTLHRRLFKSFTHPHFAEIAFSLKFLLQYPKRLINVIFSDEYLHLPLLA